MNWCCLRDWGVATAKERKVQCLSRQHVNRDDRGFEVMQMLVKWRKTAELAIAEETIASEMGFFVKCGCDGGIE